mmetsp:Transcript_63271/g.159564  ORF Transcript_63271/g.159564 Transcript_63271/m.159564 type:complete len:296 (-) Transcript_63271:274-1161(-)
MPFAAAARSVVCHGVGQACARSDGVSHSSSCEAVQGVQFRIAAQITGTLPDGTSVPGVPVFSLQEETLPRELCSGLVQAAEPAARRDIKLVDNSLAFVIDSVVPAGVADMMLALTELLGYNSAAPGIQTPPGMRMNKALHILMPDSFSRSLSDRIQHLLPQELDGCKLLGLSSRLNCYKYDDGDRFRMHIDGEWPGYGIGHDGVSMVEWPATLSKISLLLYLNDESDGVQGGATRLYSAQRVECTDQPVDVQPAKGSALLFRHGHGGDSVLHEGLRVGPGASKYVCRINVLYESC